VTSRLFTLPRIFRITPANMTHAVYWIRHKDHTDMFSEGYIGVSSNPKNRWIRHWKYNGNQHLKNAIDKYGWNNLVKEIILFGEKKYCFNVEIKIRPTRQIGWNISEGGAKPPTPQSRGPNYVSPLKGISKQTPWMIGRKVSDRERQLASERKKVKVKFNGVVYESFTALANFLGLKHATLANRIYRNAAKYGYEVLK